MKDAATADLIMEKAVENEWAILYPGPSDITFENVERTFLPFTGIGGCSACLLTEGQLKSKFFSFVLSNASHYMHNILSMYDAYFSLISRFSSGKTGNF